MKICFLNHNLKPNTGSGSFWLSFSRALKKENPDWEFKILTSMDILSGGFVSLLFNFFKIRGIFSQSEVIHALDGWPYGFIATAFSVGLRKKIVITAIGTGAVQPLYRFFKKTLMIWAYKKADKVVAISNNTKKEILKIIPNLKIEVINHGVDFEKFSSFAPTSSKTSEGRGKVTEGKQITDLKPYILSVGTLKKRKGYEYSIETFARISKQFPELKYVIVGKGPEKDNLKYQMSNLKIENKVVFFDKVEEDFLIALYHAAELFILLPQDDGKDIEGFGLVFLEAAVYGLPIIATLNTSAEDAVKNGINGFLVPTNDGKKAAEAILSIIGDIGLKEKLSRASIDFAKSMSWNKVAQYYANNIYNQF
ncbi:MAG: glycosyltransferase family 4 protein [Minisyncoccia bacterium]